MVLREFKKPKSNTMRLLLLLSFVVIVGVVVVVCLLLLSFRRFPSRASFCSYLSLLIYLALNCFESFTISWHVFHVKNLITNGRTNDDVCAVNVEWWHHLRLAYVIYTHSHTKSQIHFVILALFLPSQWIPPQAYWLDAIETSTIFNHFRFLFTLFNSGFVLFEFEITIWQ